MNKFLRGVLVLIPCVVSCTTALAQPPDPEPPVVVETKIWRTFKIKHVNPTIIAWWVFAEKAPKPEVFQVGDRQARLGINDPNFLQPKSEITKLENAEGNEAGILKLTGVDEVIGVDSRFEILACGTEEGLHQLDVLIKVLDRPLGSTLVEVLQIVMDNASAQALGVPQEKSLPGEPQDLEKFKSDLEKMVAAGKAKWWASSTANGINNITSSIGTTQLTPVTNFHLKYGDKKNWSKQFVLSQDPDKNEIFYQESRLANVTATSNNNGTTTVFLKLTEPKALVRKNLEHNKTEELLLLENHSSLTSVAIIPNGKIMFAGIVDSSGEQKLNIPDGQRMWCFVSAKGG